MRCRLFRASAASLPLVLLLFAAAAAMDARPLPGPSVRWQALPGGASESDTLERDLPPEADPGEASPLPSPNPDTSLPAHWIEGSPPRLDGRLSDPAWSRAVVADGFVQAEPSRGEPATELTEVRVVVGDGAIYVGARLLDGDPGGIRGPLARRDADVPSDWFYVYLDANRDRSTVAAFGVNPRGVKRDFLITSDGREVPDWEATWDASAVIDDLGWTIEMRIPLSQLRFGGSETDGQSPHWGVNFERRLARRGEVSSWIQLPRSRRQLASSLGDLTGLEGLSTPFRVELLPYSMARVATAGPLQPGSSTLFGTVGASLKMGLPATLTLSAAFNPDFGQVESDPAVVSVSGYRTFFPEKRPFFLEDQELFSYEIGRTRIFHSRRIGRDVALVGQTRSSLRGVPDASGILAASKISGRTPGGWSVGLLHAVTNSEVRVSIDSVGVESFEPVEPRTQYAVARLGKAFRDGRESLGGLFTFTHRGLSRTLTDDLASRAVVAGAIWNRRSEDEGLRFSAALFGSHVEGATSVIDELQRAHGRYFDRPDASHVRYDPSRTELSGVAGSVSLDRDGSGNWSWGAGSHFLTPGFEANDLGYQREADAIHQFAYLGYDRLGEGILLRRRRLTFTQWTDWTFGRERTGTGGRVDLQLQFRNLWGAVMQVEAQLPHLSPDQLRGGPALQMPGSVRQRVVLYSNPARPLSLRLDGSRTAEAETGGVLRVFRATLGFRPAGMALITLEPSVVDRDHSLEYLTRRSTTEGDAFVFGDVDQRTVSLISRLDLTLSPNLSIQFYAQPYLVTRSVATLSEVVDPRGAAVADRFRPYDPDQVRYEAGEERYYIDRDSDGGADFFFPDPAFTYGQLASNLVLRWEYRPGSTLYLVWSHDYRNRTGAGSLDPLDGFADLLGLRGVRELPATNILMVKLTYWLSP